jgi:hypothetical protein
VQQGGEECAGAKRHHCPVAGGDSTRAGNADHCKIVSRSLLKWPRAGRMRFSAPAAGIVIDISPSTVVRGSMRRASAEGDGRTRVGFLAWPTGFRVVSLVQPEPVSGFGR